MSDQRVLIGDIGPSFALPAIGAKGEDEVIVQSHILKGTPYLLYFYPKAATPGCTKQACALRDALTDLRLSNGEALKIFGVSADPIEKLKKFSHKQQLTFPLLSDEAHELANAYGTWVEKKLYGRHFMGIERSSFLLNAEGKICAAKRRVQPDKHVTWVQEALGQLSV